MYTDHTPANPLDDYWTIALVRSGSTRETHFGVFLLEDLHEALESGKVKVRDDEELTVRRIRRFPK